MQKSIFQLNVFFYKSITIPLIILISFSISNKCFAKEYMAMAINYDHKGSSGVPVGSKTGDTTGTLSISNSDIQQLILSTIPLFNNWIITSDQATLSINVNKSYLTFKIKGFLGDTATVAVELGLANDLLFFLPHSDSEIPFFVTYGNSTDAKFSRDAGKIINGCACTPVINSNQAPSGCKFSIIKAH